MSKVEVDKVIPQSGTTLTIGDSGDTINLVGTLQSNGSPLPGDISSVVAGTGLSGGGTTGAVTLNIDSAQPTITSLGTLTGLDLTDNSKIRLGTGNDLEIYHDGSNSYVDDTGTGDLLIRGSARILLRKAGTTENMIRCEADDYVKLYHNNVEKLSTTSTGVTVTGATNVDAGGEPPAEGMLLLQANSSQRQLRISPPSDSANGKIDFRGGNLTFQDDGTEVARFQGTTGFGIGTSAPTTRLDVDLSGTGETVPIVLSNRNTTAGTGQKTTLGFGLARNSGAFKSQAGTIEVGREQDWTSADTNIDSYMAFSTYLNNAGTEKLRITSSGNVGISETNPQTTLHVDGTGALFESMSIDTNLSNVTSSFSRQNTGFNYRTTEGLNVTTNSNASASLNRKSDGRILDFFKNDTRKGSISIDDNGISISLGGTATANTLDDYEEGTWTPTVDVGTVSTSGSTYTKIGRQVFLYFALSNFSDITTSSDIEVRGLPFTQSSAVSNVGGVAFGERTDVNKPIIILTSNFMRFVDGFGSSDYDDALEYANINNGSDCDIIGTINYQTDA